MINEHSRWRQAVGARFAAAYDDVEGVAAVLLAGSVARGWADEFSDVELMLFWREPPGQEPRRRAVAAGGGVLAACHGFDTDNEEWSDDVLVDGVEIQVSHRVAADTERWIGDVCDRFEPSLVKQDLIALIGYGVALRGGELIDAWRRRFAVYPEPLALAMVRRHLEFRAAWQRRKLLDRRDLVPLYDDLVHTGRRVVLVLLAMNRVYFPHLGYKWLSRVVTDLPVAPPDLAARLDAMLTAPPHQAVAEADALIVDTLTLVERHLPEAGAGAELERFRRERPVMRMPPPD